MKTAPPHAPLRSPGQSVVPHALASATAESAAGQRTNAAGLAAAGDLTNPTGPDAVGPSPLIQQGPKLAPTDEIGRGIFGESVAVSADGDTALIGGPTDNDGAGALTRSGGTLWSWTSCHISWGAASCDEGGR